MPSCDTIARPILLLAALGGIPCRAAGAQPRLDVEATRLPDSLPFSARISGEEHKGTLVAGAGLVLLGVRVVFKDSGELSRVRVDKTVLKDAAGKSYTPVAFAPIKLELVVPFAEVTQFYGGLFSTGSPEAGSSYMISAMRGPTEYSRSGRAGTSFILVFPVPADQAQFSLTLPGLAPIQLAVK